MSEQDLRPSCSSEENMLYSFHLTLFSEANEMFELWLPKITEGFFKFSENVEHRFLNISAKDGQWIASCQKPAFFMEVPLSSSYETAVFDGELLKINFEERIYLLFVEKILPERLAFHNYSILSDVEITIGGHPENDIYYRGPYVSRNHAIITYYKGRWMIRCLDRVYGLCVNRIMKTDTELRVGDVVYIMGLKIIIGQSFLAINNGLGTVTVSQRILQETSLSHEGYSHYYGHDSLEKSTQYFNRNPRKRIEVVEKVITVEGPPVSMSNNQIPLMLRMGGSMVTGGISALAGNFITLISSVLFPFLSSKYTENQRQEYERLRVSKYTEYLEKKQIEITNAIRDERRILNLKYPIVNNAIEPNEIRVHLWERRPVDNDFMRIRLGTGIRPLSVQIDYPQRRFELESDVLEDKMYQLVEKPYHVDNAPIVLPLLDTYICGILGQRKQVIEYVTQMILQVALFHSYDEVKMVFLLDKVDLEQLDDVRYIPHVWDDQRTFRFIATNEAEAYAVGEYIKEQVIEDINGDKELNHILKKRPYYLIFALEKKIFDSHEVLKDIMRLDYNCGISVITAFDELPKETQKIITLTSTGENVCTTMGVDGGDDERFELDFVPQKKISEAFHKIANISLKKITQEQAMPKVITFLEMFKTGRIEQLNSIKRWQENNPVKSLATPVGVGEDGMDFVLDLHEKRQGPHGLVAGMTGSGKSEFIITYILSMAVNYHPNEVAFVLIDYKGGGLAGAFENPQAGIRLPHLVGTITNLDGASIQRSLMSIESELVRRQRIFNEVKDIVNEGTMDIYAYQKLYRAGTVSEPMPHLFIVSDEFAELKQQQPEFMEKLISAARIGRSLGVHLILATQKPSGVVNDQIRSNTKFRVCLRVQERSDSMDMLKRPEAAELTDTGRFYLQVGYNEYFALGQSAWCGAPYTQQDTVSIQRDDVIEFLDTIGHVIIKAKPAKKKIDTGEKQIVAIVKYLSDLAKMHGIQSRQLWQPELPKTLDLIQLNKENRIQENNSMSVCLGLLDDPENQKQFPMKIDFATCSNILIAGESGSGKTVVIQNILYILANQLSPKEFNFYVLDYSSRMMKLFKSLPHCGAILQEEDAGTLDEFFKLINSLVTERKQLFSELEVDNFEMARTQRDIPLILVVIDNITGLSLTKKGEAHNYLLQSYLKNSAIYGIKYIVSCSNLREISSRVRQEFGERISLHLRDKFDYSEMVGCKTSYYPPEIPGRGLYKFEERVHEFQSAILFGGMDDKTRIQQIKQNVAELCKKYNVKCQAQGLAVVQQDAEYKEFAAQFKQYRIPLGYSTNTGKPIALPLKQFSVLGLYFGNPQGKTPILRNFLYAAEQENMEVWIIKRLKDSVFDEEACGGICKSELSDADYLSCSTGDLRLLQNALISVTTQRKDILDNYYAERGIKFEPDNINEDTFSVLQESTKPILVLIESVADFCAGLNDLSMSSYCQLFSRMHKYNVYVLGCFEPDISTELSKKAIFSIFSENDMIFFGGQINRQFIYSISNAPGAEKVLPYNVALMKYRQKAYPLIMPCGKIEQIKVDEDLENIF